MFRARISSIGPDSLGLLAALGVLVGCATGLVIVAFRLLIEVGQGLMLSSEPQTVKLRNVNGIVELDRSKVEDIRSGRLSMMPEGLLRGLNQNQVRDLFSYLRSRKQVSLTKEQQKQGAKK